MYWSLNSTKNRIFSSLSDVENPDTRRSCLQGFEKITGSARPSAGGEMVQYLLWNKITLKRTINQNIRQSVSFCLMLIIYSYFVGGIANRGSYHIAAKSAILVELNFMVAKKP